MTTKRSKTGAGKDNIGLHNAISSQKLNIEDRKDNSFWWTLGLLLFISAVGAVWFDLTA
ncbi:MAG: hypothetical protein NE330_14425 [Lentisphaeraceae bacterium]|nr:hypothetical protein [Lentisphaeraceae bacterium]